VTGIQTASAAPKGAAEAVFLFSHLPLFAGQQHLESIPNEAFVENLQPFAGTHSVRPYRIIQKTGHFSGKSGKLYLVIHLSKLQIPAFLCD
jgi:hypothetical protein